MDEPNRDKVRAEEVEGLRVWELITQVVREERALFYPRPLVEDMVVQFLSLLIP